MIILESAAGKTEESGKNRLVDLMGQYWFKNTNPQIKCIPI